jgi:hypothetical protein
MAKPKFRKLTIEELRAVRLRILELTNAEMKTHEITRTLQKDGFTRADGKALTARDVSIYKHHNKTGKLLYNRHPLTTGATTKTRKVDTGYALAEAMAQGYTITKPEVKTEESDDSMALAALVFGANLSEARKKSLLANIFRT